MDGGRYELVFLRAWVFLPLCEGLLSSCESFSSCLILLSLEEFWKALARLPLPLAEHDLESDDTIPYIIRARASCTRASTCRASRGDALVRRSSPSSSQLDVFDVAHQRPSSGKQKGGLQENAIHLQ